MEHDFVVRGSRSMTSSSLSTAGVLEEPSSMSGMGLFGSMGGGGGGGSGVGGGDEEAGAVAAVAAVAAAEAAAAAEGGGGSGVVVAPAATEGGAGTQEVTASEHVDFVFFLNVSQ